MGANVELLAIGVFCCAAVAAGIALGVTRRQIAQLRAENQRWRSIAAERADRAAMLSHELRTPLALLVGSAEVLADAHVGPLTPRQSALVESIGFNSHIMATLVEDILTDARIDAQIFAMRTARVNLRRLARDVIADLRKLYPNRLSLECRGYPPSAAGDPQLLRQVLINLVTNAARHGGADADISIGVRRTDGAVLLSVTDTGTGMTPQQRRQLFHRTLRGASETGNGLGLIITRRIIDLHGGRLLIDTEASRGTTVIARLPELRAPGREEPAPGELPGG
ncbi:MAG: HAMP domain-containing sensor histidine kinase [Propionibacteriaceae bacterium]|nr:HAMP domain-containing sensor histidine kinase [Propionibacteriaceae bacterium]